MNKMTYDGYRKAILRPGFLLASAIALALLVVACGGGGGSSDSSPPASPSSVSVHLQRVPDASTTFAFPVLVTAPPGDTARLFVVEKSGTITIVDKATNTITGTFLDISGLVTGGGEQGLLGLAFDPGYASNGRFYVSYTNKTGNGNSVIARYLVSSGSANVADPTSAQIVLTLVQPDTNHNGGMIVFGPDNMLYIGFGDGGGSGDPSGNGQNLAVLLGKILRIDVSTLPYTIPSDNPFASAAQGKEIWSYGLRNPWRYSFDRQTHDLYIADVGQDNWEEVDIATHVSGGGNGLNYGWNVMEGNHCYPPGTASCATAGKTLPRIEYDHSGGACSITGGYVYRGSAIPSLRGTYFYGDFCAGFVRSLALINGTATQFFDWPTLRPAGANITSFGEDGAGELYIMTSAGALYRIVPN
jgi:glucose/arabinose dehydrogenase